MERLFQDPDFLEKVRSSANLSTGDKLRLILYFKYGMDGTSGFSEYHQKSDSGSVIKEKSVLATQMCIIRLVKSDGTIVYQNPLCNSASSSRVLRLSYEKETTGMILFSF
jgi:hypothetical protein